MRKRRLQRQREAAGAAWPSFLFRSVFSFRESNFFGRRSELSSASFALSTTNEGKEERKKNADSLLFTMVTFDAELFGSRLGRLYTSWRVRAC